MRQACVKRGEGRCKIAGMGSAGLDYLAVVSAFPQPDQKIRTESFEVQGGGNCGNALTGAAKLGLHPYIITKVGDDSVGKQTLSQLKEEGIDTGCVVIAEGRPSGFTYIIVDPSGDTRTCIHTPADPLDPSELSPDVITQFLKDARLVYFDGRLTEAAIGVARKAKELKIPVLVEAERLRPNLEHLIDLADIIVTSKNFPQDFSGEDYLGDALLAMMERFRNAKTIVTTLGDRGALALEMTNTSHERAPLHDKIEQAWKRLDATPIPESNPDCVSKNNTPIWYGPSIVLEAFLPTLKRSAASNASVQATARAHARAAAIADARPDAHQSYRISNAPPSPSSVQLTVAAASKISKDAIVDTTGAGDAFIAAVMYGIVHAFPLPDLLKFASLVAACKCTEIGARAGQPRLDNIKSVLCSQKLHL